MHDVGIRKRFAPRAAMLSGAAIALLAFGPVPAMAQTAPIPEVSTIGRHVETDEMVTPRQMPRVKQRRPAVKSAKAKSDGAEGVWLFEYVARLLGSEPEVARRPRIAKPRPAPTKRPATAHAAAATVVKPSPVAELSDNAQPNQNRVTILPSAPIRPITPVAPAASETTAAAPAPQQQAAITPASPVTASALPAIVKRASAATEMAPPAAGSDIRASAPAVMPPTIAARPDAVAPKSEPIVTGALPGLGDLHPAVPRIVTPDASEALVEAAERAQARADLVKLELASRTYAERRISGQSVFDLRLDWKVLERARDALSESETAAADAAGFEANAYVNDTTRTIVIAVAGSEDLRRDFLQADIWDALIRAQMPQQFFLAKTYTRSIIQRYQSKGYTAECVGHSLGGGACAYVAAELGIRAIVVNPISAGKLPAGARHLVTNYVVDGEIANLVYGARGNQIAGDVHQISGGRAEARERAIEKYGPLSGPVLVVKTLSDLVRGHKVERALDLIAQHAGIERPR